MLDRVRDYINRHGLIADGETVLVGVSGGMDSMVLLHVLQALDIHVEVAHVNYKMRGHESDEDEQRVVLYCNEQDISCHVLTLTPDAIQQQKGESFQDKARKIRYAYFLSEAEKRGLSRVAVAHHLDDQAETVLLNLFQGSGIEGLAGMLPSRVLRAGHEVALIRPLLACTKAEMLTYANDHSIPWREDRTNATVVYRRNALRNRIFPLIKEHFGEAVPGQIAHSASILAGYWKESLRPELSGRAALCYDENKGLNIDELKKQPDVWQKRILLDALYTWQPAATNSLHMVDAVLALLEAQVGRKAELSQGEVWREREYLVFRPAETPVKETYLVQLNDTFTFSQGELQVRIEAPLSDPPVIMDQNVIVADASRLLFPLILRPWRSGDRMIPFGMAGHKKVSDILTDAKMPSHLREGVHVVESAGEIIWVVGVRMADPVKLDEHTEEVVRFTFIPR